jgi:drug/metabolite transporter (DMT)-like permease
MNTAVTGDNDRRAMLHALGAVALWSTVATAFKLSLYHLSPLALVTLASCTSWLLFALVLWRTGFRNAYRGASRRDVVTALAIGMLNPALYYFLLFAAYDRLPAQEAMAINYTWAITLALLAAPLLRHRLGRQELAAAAVSYLGVFVIATRGDVLGIRFADPVGVGLALASTLVWALCWIANTRHRLAPAAGLFLNFTAATPVLLLVSWSSGQFDDLAWPGAVGGLYVGIVEMGVSFLLWLSAMKLTTNTLRISTLIFLAPPVSLTIIWAVLGEPIMPTTLVGLALVLGGLALQHREPRTAARAR